MNFFCLCPGLLLYPLADAGAQPIGFSMSVPPRQMVLVITKNWDAIHGKLQRFELGAQGWQAVGPKFDVVIGRNGMAWGTGVHPMPQTGPQKKEGDGKSPAGVFELGSAFGFASADKMAGIKIPYVQCTRTLECVDDSKSFHYNQIVDRAQVQKPDWTSSEHMLEPDPQYRLGIVVEHNSSPPVPGGGSCVFMHVWINENTGTAGCTAMTQGNIESVVAWLDAQAHPVLAQLPEAEYERVKKDWRLPEMP